MAAPNFTIIKGGQINQAGDARALFLKVYGGEVFTAFDETNIFKALHMVRTISTGKSAQFPSIGGKTAAYHTPGQMIDGTPGSMAETLLSIDDFLYAASAIADIDQAMSHFDYRGPFAKEDGRAIARQYDSNVAAVIMQAALTTTSRLKAGDIYEGRTKGFVDNRANTDTSVAAIKAGLLAVAINFDQKDIPDQDRNAAMKPAQYALVASDPDTINSQYGGLADQRTLKVPQLYGFNLRKTNNLPTTNVTGTYSDKYNVDARNATVLCWTPQAAGTLAVRDLAVSMTGEDYHVTHNATLVKSQMLVGHGPLRPECAALIRTADPAA
jgi:hypothetical protein